MQDVLKSVYYNSLLGYDNVDWFVGEDIKLENKIAFYFKNTTKDISMTEKDAEDFRSKIICSFLKNLLNLIKLEIFVI